ncbi:MAG: hypothetical protein KF689_00475 [Gemmatimonadaceae bacterium]|nr:hypothetical protein [Gemmatimonadaceae bacterium]MCW5826402.1 hypothetical protein [Gemmatimonadaceae bacterium]
MEEASEELARAEALIGLTPGALPMLLQAGAVAALTTSLPEAMRSARAALVAAWVDPTHAGIVDPAMEQWQRRLEDEERRVRGGLPLTVSRFADLLGADADRELLEDALRPGGQTRPQLLRAVQAAAACGDEEPNVAAAVLPALLLCATGMTDRVRILPFIGFTGDARREAIAEWRRGEPGPFLRGALGALSAEARHLRVSLRLLLEALKEEEATLEPLGRAAIGARRALEVLRASLATTVPDLSVRLDCSRPAAGAALERLVQTGLALEITGRARDRVFVHAGVWEIG